MFFSLYTLVNRGRYKSLIVYVGIDTLQPQASVTAMKDNFDCGVAKPRYNNLPTW